MGIQPSRLASIAKDLSDAALSDLACSLEHVYLRIGREKIFDCIVCQEGYVGIKFHTKRRDVISVPD